MATNMANARLVLHLGGFRLLQMGAAGAALTGLLSGIAAWTGWGGLFGLAVPLFAFVSFSGLIVANSIAGALARFPDRAGAVSAFVGAMHYGAGILGSALVGIFADGTPWPMGWIIAASGIGSVLCAWLAAQPLACLRPLYSRDITAFHFRLLALNATYRDAAIWKRSGNNGHVAGIINRSKMTDADIEHQFCCGATGFAVTHNVDS